MGGRRVSTALEQLKEHLAQVSDLWDAAALLSWDQQVNMPAGGSEVRAHHLSTVQSLAHSRFLSDETGELLTKAAEEVTGLATGEHPPARRQVQASGIGQARDGGGDAG